MSAVSERLELDISDALSSVDQLEARIIDLFTGIDASPLSSAINDALSSVDTSGLSSTISDAVSSIDAPPVEITAEIDTAQVEAELGGVTEASTAAGAGLVDAAGAANLAGAGFQAATGNTAALGGAIGGLSGEAGAVVGVLGAGAAATKVFFDAAVEAEAATTRFTNVFGDMGAEIEKVDIGGLNTTLSELAVQVGADDDALRLAVSTLGELGTASGQTKEQVAGTAEQMLALAARLSVVNPGLGTADQIMERLPQAFVRGGRSAAQFGISLSTAEIQQRAFADTGKTSAAELSIFDKVAAGAALQTERLGDALGTDVAEGAEQAFVKVRSIHQALEETIEAAGEPLIEPLLASMEELEPVLESVAETTGTLLVPAIEGLAVNLELLGSTFGPVSDGLSFLNEKMGESEEQSVTLGEAAAGAANPFVALRNIFVSGKDSLQAWGIVGKDVAEVTETTGRHVSWLSEQIDRINVVAANAGIGLGFIRDSADDLPTPIENAADALGRAVDITNDLDVALRELNETLENTLDPVISAQAAHAKLGDAMREMVEAQVENKFAFDANSEAGSDNIQKFERLYSTLRDNVIPALVESGEVGRSTADQQTYLRDRLQDMANKVEGPVRDAILAHIARLDSVRKQTDVKTKIDVEDTDAKDKLGWIERALDRVRGKHTVELSVLSRGAKALGFQSGGPFEAFQPIEVGEAGRELIIPRQPGFVVDNAQTERILDRGGFSDAQFDRLLAALAAQRPITVNEVARDPEATAIAVSRRIGADARR